MLTAAILLVVFFVFLTLPPGERLIKSVLESQIEASIYQQVSIGHLETNLLSRFVLTDLRIHDIDRPADKSIIRIQRIALRYNLRSLLHRELKLLSVNVDSVTVSVTRDSVNRSNLTVVDSLDVLLADTTALPISITLDTLAVNDVDLDYHDDVSGIQLRVEGVRIHLAGANENYFRYYFHIPSARGVYDSIPLYLAAFHCSGSWRDESLIVEELSGSSADLRFHGNGSYVLSDSTIDGTLVISGNPDSLISPFATRLGSSPIVTQGEILAVLQVGGAVSQPNGRLILDLPPIQTDALQTGNCHLAVSLKHDTLSIDSALIRILDGVVHADGVIAADTTLWSDIRVRLSSLALEQVASVAAGPSLSVAGRIDGDVTLTGTILDPAKLDTRSDWRVRKARWEDRAVPDVNIQAALQQGLANMTLDGAGLALQASGQIQGEQVVGDYSITIPDFGHSAHYFGVENVSGALSVTGTFSGDQNQPAVHATVVAERLRYQNLPLDSLYAAVHFENDSLHIEKLTFAGGWRGSDSADAFFSLHPLRGAFVYSGSASGPLTGIDGGVEVHVSDFGMDTGPRVSGQTSVTIEGSRVVNLKSELAADSLELNVSGQYDLIDSSASLTATVNSPSPEGEIEKSKRSQADSIVRDSLMNAALAWLTINATDLGSDSLAILFDAGINTVAPLLARWSDTLAIDGRLSLAGQARGPLEDPQVDFVLEASEVQYETWNLDSLFAQAALSRESLRCDSFEVYAPGASVQGLAEIPISLDTLGSYAIDMSRSGYGRLRIPQLDLELTRPLLPADANISGKMEIDLEWEGQLDRPNLRGWASLTDARFQSGPESHPVENIRARVSFADSTLTIDSLRGMIRGFPFDVSGRATLVGPEVYHGELDCDLGELGTGHLQGLMQGDSLRFSARTRAPTGGLITLRSLDPGVQGLHRY